MKKIRILSLMLALLFVFLAFASCAEEPNTELTETQPQESTNVSDSITTEPTETTNKVTETNEITDTSGNETIESTETTDNQNTESIETSNTETTEFIETSNTETDESTETTDIETTAPECTHDWVAATCTAPKTCKTCDATEGDALGHTWDNGTSISDAKCGEAGEVKFTCTVEDCGATRTEVVAALNHDWADATCTAPKTCKRENCEYTEGEALTHDWVDATCTAPKTCQREGCGLTEGAELGHAWVDATYTAPKTCSTCEVTEGYPKGFTKYLDSIAVSDALKKGTHSGGTVISADKSYVTVSLDVANNKVESYFNLFSGNTEATGQYLIIKYRTSSAAGYMEIYASTEVGGAGDAQKLGGYFAPDNEKGLYLKDGEWHVIAIDLSEAMKDTAFAANGEGEYVAKFVRLDLFNVSKSNTEECSIDIAFIGMCENYEDVISYSNTTLFYDTELKTVCDHDWKIVDVNGGKICNLCGLVDKRAVFFNIDGLGDKAAGRYSDVVVLAEGHAKYPVGGFTTDATTLGKLYFSGWIGTYEDISSLVFRVTDESGNVSDWITFEKNGSTAIVRETTDSGIINAVTNNLGADAYRHRIGGWMDLNDYAGQTVKVEIAIVLKDIPAEQQYFTIITAENVHVTN